MNIVVREMESIDIPFLLDYWYGADEAYLRGMGADIHKLPNRVQFEVALERQLNLPYPEKQAYALIWWIDGERVGHSNLNPVSFGESAYMHLHLWNSISRKKGIGTLLVQNSLPFYFKHFELPVLFCQPYALNPAPNKTLPKVGFEKVKTYRTIPGTLNFEQEVNLWQLSRERFESLRKI